MDSPLTPPIREHVSHTITYGTSPIIATSIHAGHNMRANLIDKCALSDLERLYEEDPHTDQWVSITDNTMIAHYSRFEFDLNRSREKTVYRKPEDAWGLKVWKEELPEDLVQESLAKYDEFYSDAKDLLGEIQQKHGAFILYDLHSYNYKREGPEGPDADPEMNPEVIIGTGNMNREKWAPVVESIIRTIESYKYKGRRLDVRENVKFIGGNFNHWIHDTFPDQACVLSIEFKKFFMNEWTGEPDQEQLDEIKNLLQKTTEPVLKAFYEVVNSSGL